MISVNYLTPEVLRGCSRGLSIRSARYPPPGVRQGVVPPPPPARPVDFPICEGVSLAFAKGLTMNIEPGASRPTLSPITFSDDTDEDLDEMLEIAAEQDERGPLATIECMLEALRVRHGDDDTTLAILAAVQYLHLPDLIDIERGL